MNFFGYYYSKYKNNDTKNSGKNKRNVLKYAKNG